MCRCYIKWQIWILALAVVMITPFGEAASVFMGGWENDTYFYEYDIDLNSWSQRQTLPSGVVATLACDDTYVYAMCDNNYIYRYDTVAMSWSQLISHSNAATRNTVFCYANGEFYWVLANGTTVYYGSGGNWSSFSTPYSVGASYGYDDAAKILYFRIRGQTGYMAVDTTTHTVTDYCSGIGSNGEWDRCSGVIDGRFYSSNGNGTIYEFTNPPSSCGYDTWGSYSNSYPGGCAGPDGRLYIAPYSNNSTFQAFDPVSHTFTSLSGKPTTIRMPSLAAPEAYSASTPTPSPTATASPTPTITPTPTATGTPPPIPALSAGSLCLLLACFGFVLAHRRTRF